MAFDSLHNYYERLVFSQIHDEVNKQQLNANSDTLEDIACVALNQLPARYIRHDIDLAFYLSTDEREKLDRSVIQAVNYALEFVQSRNEKNKPS